MADSAPEAAPAPGQTPSKTEAKSKSSKTGTPKSTPSKTKSSEIKYGEGGGGDEVEEKKKEEEKPPKISRGQKVKAYCKDVCTYLYNPKTHLCMGRNCKQWGCLLAFIMCSYTAIGLLFAGLLSIVLMHAPLNRPQYVAEPDHYFTSKIQQNPGVIFVPEADQVTNEDSAVILLNSQSSRTWGRMVDTYLHGHDKYWELHNDSCKGKVLPNGIVRVPKTEKNNCFYIDPLTLNPGCDLKNLYGYAPLDGHIQPTFIVRLSRVWGWKPEPFKTDTDIEAAFKNVKGPLKYQMGYVNETWQILKSENGNKPPNGVFVLCDAESDTDNDLLGQITYCTLPFIDGKYFPFKSQKAYISPFIIVQIKYAAVGIPIKIQCYPFAKNTHIEQDKKDEDAFEIMID